MSTGTGTGSDTRGVGGREGSGGSGGIEGKFHSFSTTADTGANAGTDALATRRAPEAIAAEREPKSGDGAGAKRRRVGARSAAAC